MQYNFLQFVVIKDCLEKLGSFAIHEDFDWAKSYTLPNLDLDLPTIEKKSKINIIMPNKNPIYIQLADGTKLFFTLDEFRRLNDEPKVGKMMIVKMLRLPNDTTLAPSQIKSCTVA